MKNLSTSDIARSTSRDDRERERDEEAREHEARLDELREAEPREGGDLRRARELPEAEIQAPHEERPRLLSRENEGELQSRWTAIQTGFVDEPRRAVKEADELVAEVMRQIADLFSKERTNLEQQWDRHDDVSTEDLRLALQRYRSFFGRLLTV